MLIGLVSAKGSPGVTTCALAVAAEWPRPVIVVDADPAGGDIAAGLGRGAWPDGCHLLELAARCRTTTVAAALAELAVQVGEHTAPVLAGLGSPAQAAVLPWAHIGRGLAGLGDVDVLCDAGRYVHGAGNIDLLDVCDRLVVVTRSTLPAVRATSRLIDLLRARGLLGPRIGVLVVDPGNPYSADDVAEGCRTPLVGTLPHDPRTSTVWTRGSAPGRGLARSALQRAAHAVATAWAPAELVAR